MIRFFLISFFLITISFSANSHVEHYKDLNKLEFDLYRNNKLIGTHIFDFIRIEDQLIVNSKITFQIKKLGMVLYRYEAEGTEIYNKDGNLINFESRTNQNKKVL